MNAAYKAKIDKYEVCGFSKYIIPIVVNPTLEIHPKSAESMKEYVNLSQLFKQLAYRISKQSVDNETIYIERRRDSNQKHAENLSSAPGSHQSASYNGKVSYGKRDYDRCVQQEIKGQTVNKIGVDPIEITVDALPRPNGNQQRDNADA